MWILHLAACCCILLEHHDAAYSLFCMLVVVLHDKQYLMLEAETCAPFNQSSGSSSRCHLNLAAWQEEVCDISIQPPPQPANW